MNKKNEGNKNTENVAEQSESTQSVESAAAPDTTTSAGTDVEGPEDAPADGPGLEGVTVVIVETNEKHALLAAESVKRNLTGVDCLVVRLELGELTLPQALLRFINEASRAERIVLMTDQMLLLNPVTLADIAVIKGKRLDKTVDYDLRMPVMLHRSVLQDFLPWMIADFPFANLATLYFGSVHAKINPIDPGEWNKNCWLLPIISKNPPIDTVEKWAKTQKFAFVSDQSWSDELVEFLEERFAE